MTLQIRLKNDSQRQQFEHAEGPLEFGRGPRREAKRYTVDDLFVSRDQLRIQELPGGRVQVENLSPTNPIKVLDGATISPSQTQELPLPVQLAVGKTSIVINAVAAAAAPSGTAEPAPAIPAPLAATSEPGTRPVATPPPATGTPPSEKPRPPAPAPPPPPVQPSRPAETAQPLAPPAARPAERSPPAPETPPRPAEPAPRVTPAPVRPAEPAAASGAAATEKLALESLIAIEPARPRPLKKRALGTAADQPTPESLAVWLQTVIDLQQAAAGSPEFYRQTAEALVDLIDLDLGLVLLKKDADWTIAGCAVADDTVSVRYSRTLVSHVVAERRTLYRDLSQMSSQAASLSNIEAAVVSPIFGLHDDVVGVLYGVRTERGLIGRGAIQPLEAQLVQLLAAAAGGNLARALAVRTRVQFEQFFSSDLVRELERDPELLEGRSTEVTVLFSDLRGFTALSQRLGADKTCRMVRDMMERLSVQIVDHGGVIVDYAGDGILAMWNAPAKQSDHAVRACRAALAMLGELPELNARWKEVSGALALGIGINTGVAQVGNTGSTRKFKYGPHGHTVNLASRVQDATKKLGLPLLITGSTREQLPANFGVRRLGRVQLPGVKEPVVLHELRGEQEDPKWLSLRDTYEQALAQYESQQWSSACQTLMPLLTVTEGRESFDTPTRRLLRRAWECLEQPPDPFEPIIEVSTK